MYISEDQKERIAWWIVNAFIALLVIFFAWLTLGCASIKPKVIQEVERYGPLLLESLDPGPDGYEGEATLMICAGNLCADASCYGKLSDYETMIDCKRRGPYPREEAYHEGE